MVLRVWAHVPQPAHGGQVTTADTLVLSSIPPGLGTELTPQTYLQAPLPAESWHRPRVCLFVSFIDTLFIYSISGWRLPLSYLPQSLSLPSPSYPASPSLQDTAGLP